MGSRWCCPIFVSGSKEETSPVVSAGHYETAEEDTNYPLGATSSSQHGRNRPQRPNGVGNVSSPCTAGTVQPVSSSQSPARLFHVRPHDDGNGPTLVEELIQHSERSTTKIEELERENKRLKEQLQLEKAEKEKALLRLSETASSKLVDNNPNITDLSDQNRATKLAEKFSELYDNEWTDAYQLLLQNEMTEKVAVKLLLQILKNAADVASQMASTDTARFEETVCGFLQTNNTNEEVKAILKRFKDCRKRNAALGLGLDRVEQGVREKLTEDKKINNAACDVICQDYIKKCVSLCWLMNINDPPLVFEFGKPNDVLQKELYKSYTEDGKIIKFIVWPVLYLHQGGAVLSKGIAQGKKKVKKSKGQKKTAVGNQPNTDPIETVSIKTVESDEDDVRKPWQKQKDVEKLNLTGISQLSSSLPNVPIDGTIAVNSPSPIPTSRMVEAMCSPRPPTDRSLRSNPNLLSAGQTITRPTFSSLAQSGQESMTEAWTVQHGENTTESSSQRSATHEDEQNGQNMQTNITIGSNAQHFHRPQTAPE